MKKVIICGMLLIISTAAFSQENNPSQMTKQDYLKKGRHQQTAAIILLSGGILSTGLGSIRFKNDDGTYGNSRNTVFLVTGLAAIGGSIVLFAASSRNKRKARSMTFKNETVPQLKNGIYTTRFVPSFNLKVNL